MNKQSRSDAAMALGIAALGVGLVLLGSNLLAHWQRQSAAGQSFEFDDGVGVLAVAAGLAVVLWWVSAMLMAIVSAVAENRGRHRLASATAGYAPAFMRRLVLVVVGLNLVSAPLANAAQNPPVSPLWQPVAMAKATPSPNNPGPLHPTPAVQAAPDHADTVSPLWRPTAPALSPGPLAAAPSRDAFGTGTTQVFPPKAWPAQPTTLQPKAAPSKAAEPKAAQPKSTKSETAPARARKTAPAVDNSSAAQVVVKAGDSLWSIAATALGPLATDVEIAQAWPAWFNANRSVIGADPGVILPGQILQAPHL